MIASHKRTTGTIRRGHGRQRHRIAASAFSCVVLILAGGCTTVAYYGQAVRGHFALMNERRPITEVLASDRAAPDLKRRLRMALDAREFAVARLALPANGSYRSYADLGREQVLWNVFATPELSLEPVRSCFPVSGCLAYRGYFSRTDAQRYAAALETRGHDVYIAGVSAYSTLGWFDDPLLNTMMRWRDSRLIGIMFHELTHQRIYVKGDTAFNEALAVAVADAGVQLWLTERAPDLLADYHRDAARDRAFVDLVLATRARLERLYASALAAEAKRTRKQAILDRFRADYRVLRDGWNDYGGYDAWVDTTLNNAKFASVTTYHALVPAFAAFLRGLDYDFERFFTVLEAFAELSPAERRTCLERLKEMPEQPCSGFVEPTRA